MIVASATAGSVLARVAAPAAAALSAVASAAAHNAADAMRRYFMKVVSFVVGPGRCRHEVADRHPLVRFAGPGGCRKKDATA
jgi:hypothetical protein